ncbi:MAG: branched-chain amino acid ABC transporter permease [Promethearchaeota archaeon]
MTGADIVSFLFNGSLQGAVLALVAMGYSLVYGVGNVMNLAHGAYFMLTGYLLLTMSMFIFPGFVGFTAGGENVSLGILMIIISLVIITILGGLSYILLIKPLQNSAVGVVLITFALAFFFEQLIQSTEFGTETWSISKFAVFEGKTRFLGTDIINQYIFLIICALVVVLLFALFINKSKLGKSIRAVSQDSEAATLMGINSNRVLFYTVMISAFLSGIAAVLFLPAGTIDGPSMGWTYLTNAFAVVIVGGMGSIYGSIVGAFIIGYIGSFTNVIIPMIIPSFPGPSWKGVVPLVIIIIMLLIKPQGLFGKKEID